MRGMWAETNVNAEESETAITVAVVIQLMWTMVVMGRDKDAMRWIWGEIGVLQSKRERRGDGMECVLFCLSFEGKRV